ncbi:unnamed protein product [Schistosoma intercalatum]|nr:unnamed protein product [Schistosoma intercalatum]
MLLTFPRGVMKRKEDFLYSSVDMDVAEVQAGNSRVQYPKFWVFDKFISQIANSTQLGISPSTSESKNVGGAIAVASKFTLLDTTSKRALQKCKFYGCIRMP